MAARVLHNPAVVAVVARAGARLRHEEAGGMFHTAADVVDAAYAQMHADFSSGVTRFLFD